MYARVNDETGVLECRVGSLPPEGIGPVLPPPVEPGFTYHLLTEAVDWSGRPSDTAIMLWNGGAYRWHETAPIEQIRAAALQAIDASAEAMRMAVVNRMTMQTEEYRRVEAQARAWREAGYPEGEGVDVPRGVTGWAMAKWRDGWTNRQAADDILATADGWMQILDTLRDLRLANKEDVRHATDPVTIAAIRSDMQADMRAMAQQLNLTLTE